MEKVAECDEDSVRREIGRGWGLGGGGTFKEGDFKIIASFKNTYIY